MLVTWQILKQRFLRAPLADLSGGLMAAIVALPLCLAFGVASGLGAQAGLYGAIASGILAAMFGGTPAQCSGPTGPMTVVAAALYSTYHDRVDLIYASIITAGLMQIIIGKMKGGDFVAYMPYPVISGFMTGIGAIIILIELAPLLGVTGSGNALMAVQGLVDAIAHCKKDALLISAITLLIIYLLPYLTKRVPATLVALLFTGWISQQLKLELPRIGDIPSGLPLPRVPSMHLTDMHVIIQNGLTLAILGSIDSLLTSVVLDKVARAKHNSNQELVGQGIGNIFAGLIGGLPGAGATMRSMVNVKAGGVSYLSGVLHGLILLAVLMGLGKIAALIPLASLAAILLSVGISIMDWRVLKGLGKIPKADALVMLVVLLLTIFVDLIVAVLTGVALASIIFVKQLADAQTSTVEDLDTLEELRRHAEHIPEAIRKLTYVYQFDGPLFFGEAKNLNASVEKLYAARYIIMRFNNVPLVDQTAAFALETAIEKWEAKGIKLFFVGMPGSIKRILAETGAIDRIAKESYFDQFDDAIAAIDTLEMQRAVTKPERSQ